MGQSALATRYPRLLARPLMRDAFGVRRFAAPAGDLTQSGSIEQCESSEMFGGHGALVLEWVISLPGASRGSSGRRRARVAVSLRMRRRRHPRVPRVLQRQSHPFCRGSRAAARNPRPAVARVCEPVTMRSRRPARDATRGSGSRTRGSGARGGCFRSAGRSRGRERHIGVATVAREARSWPVGSRGRQSKSPAGGRSGKTAPEICEPPAAARSKMARRVPP
jgi:hypothetical protein